MSSTAPSTRVDIDLNADREPWAQDTILIIPIEATQVLVAESAAILGVHAFLKMTKLPYTVREMPNATSISPTGKVPVINSGQYVVSELENIVQLATSKGVSLSDHLSVSEKADLRAYMSLVHSVLEKALLYFTWLDNFVYENVTKHRVGSPYNFPLKVLVPWVTRRQAIGQLKGVKWAEMNIDQVCRQVETCLIALSERLGENEFFFGSNPTELDALTFGYLFTMITTPLNPQNRFGELVKQQGNLVRFCQRVENQYFSSKEK